MYLLLKRGANIATQSEDGGDCACFAATCNRVPVLNLLIRTKEDILKMEYRHGYTLLSAARWHGMYDAAQYILKYMKENYNLVTERLEQYINYEDGKNCTPIIYAVINGHTKLVELLWEFGANIYHVAQGQTVLQWAKEYKNATMIKVVKRLMKLPQDGDWKVNSANMLGHFVVEYNFCMRYALPLAINPGILNTFY